MSVWGAAVGLCAVEGKAVVPLILPSAEMLTQRSSFTSSHLVRRKRVRQPITAEREPGRWLVVSIGWHAPDLSVVQLERLGRSESGAIPHSVK